MASTTPPVKIEIPAATPSKATGRDLNWSIKILKLLRLAVSDKTFDPYLCRFATAYSWDNPNVEVLNAV